MENEPKQPPTTPTDQVRVTSPMYLTRVGTRQFIAKTRDGVEVPIGDQPGQLTPGQLLQLAVAGCKALVADARFQAVLGEDFAQVVGISGDFNQTRDRYDALYTEFIQDLSALSEEEIHTLARRIDAAINRNCTVAHTLDFQPSSTHTLTSKAVEPKE